MLQETAEDYSKYLAVDLNTQLQPVSHAIDEMLVRLEEFEAMIAIVQQERCNAIGITGSLTDILDNKEELMNLFKRVDTIEKLVNHVETNVDMLEHKIETAENQHGMTDNAAKLKNFFLPLFKKVPEVKTTQEEDLEIFKTEQYFTPESSEST